MTTHKSSARRSWPLALVLAFSLAGCESLSECWDMMMGDGASLHTPQDIHVSMTVREE